MARIKTNYVCQSCGFFYPRWTGKCKSCGGWNTLKEEITGSISDGGVVGREIEVKKIDEIDDKETMMSKTTIKELDQVLGGGIVLGSLILLGGDPGIGKSTLALQVASRVKNTLYFSGEESSRQIQMRSKRLGASGNVFVALETNVENIIETIKKNKHGLVIIDSIQTMYSGDVQGTAGNVSQLSMCTSKLIDAAKNLHVPIVIIGHVTKEGNIAGPRVLEHLVDVVLYLEGDRFGNFRILRGIKNRFGSTNEVGVFEMTSKGLNEISNPSKIMIEGRSEKVPGSVVFPTIEGTRPLLCEVQALSSSTSFGYPKRTSSGFDLNRLQLLVAVLQKRCKLNLSAQDIYLNVAGGIKINEPAVDLAVALAIASVFKNKEIKNSMVVFGEIGLAGEVRSVNNVNKRLAEASRLGFGSAVVPRLDKKAKSLVSRKKPSSLDVIEVSSIKEALDKVL